MMEKHTQKYIRLLLFAATLAGAFWLGSVAYDNPAVQNLILSGGYLGVFLFSIINGFNVIVPIITASFVPALASAGLNPYVLVLVMSLGMSIADATAFFLARAGRVHVTNGRANIVRKVASVEQKRRWFPLGILAAWSLAVPLPNEVILIPLGLLGYRAREVLPVILIGNCIFNVAIGFGFLELFGRP